MPKEHKKPSHCSAVVLCVTLAYSQNVTKVKKHNLFFMKIMIQNLGRRKPRLGMQPLALPFIRCLFKHLQILCLHTNSG